MTIATGKPVAYKAVAKGSWSPRILEDGPVRVDPSQPLTHQGNPRCIVRHVPGSRFLGHITPNKGLGQGVILR